MKQERTQNQKQKPYPVNPQARPDYLDDNEHLPGQRQHPIEAYEDDQTGNRADDRRDDRVNQPQSDRQGGQKANPGSGQDAQTREDIQRAEQEGMVKNKEGNQAESKDKKSSRRSGNQARKH